MGPLGPLTLEDLPSSSTTYWVCRRKAEVLAAIDGGLLSVEEARARYRLSHEELAGWRRTIERAGVAGLRITRLKQYRKPAAGQGENGRAHVGTPGTNAHIVSRLPV